MRYRFSGPALLPETAERLEKQIRDNLTKCGFTVHELAIMRRNADTVVYGIVEGKRGKQGYDAICLTLRSPVFTPTTPIVKPVTPQLEEAPNVAESRESAQEPVAAPLETASETSNPSDAEKN